MMAATPPPTAGEPPSPATSPPPQAAGNAAAASEADEETRVITLDTIIRKGLTERMPMTAKDVENIVSKSMQKERERQAADRLRLAANKNQQPHENASGTSSAKVAFGNVNRAAATESPTDSDKSDTESSDTDTYYSNNDDDADDNDAAGAAKPSPIKMPTTFVSQRTSTKVNAKHPAQPVCNEMQLAEDLRASNAQTVSLASSSDELPHCEEDSDLRSGDLHYSESNTSDYSDVEHHQHRNFNRHLRHSQPQGGGDDAPIAGRRKRNVVEAATATAAGPATATRKRSFVAVAGGDDESTAGRSCTDSKRNAILLQCSAAASAKMQRRSPADVADAESAVAESAAADAEPSVEGAEPAVEDAEPVVGDADPAFANQDPEPGDLLNVESMLQVQHRMDDYNEYTDGNNTDIDDETSLNDRYYADDNHSSNITFESSMVIKLERYTPDDEILESQQTEPILASVQPGKKSCGGSRGGGDVFVNKASVTNAKKTSTKDKSTAVAVETKGPTIQAVYSVHPSAIAGAATTSAETIPARNRRESTFKSQPLYTELSDNELQPTDDTPKSKKRSSKAATAVKPAPTVAGSAPTPKVHWKTKLKLQRQQKAMADGASDALEAAGAVDAARALNTTEALDTANKKPSNEGMAQAVDDAVSSATSPHINKIIEPPHHQKRIPKLKYDSFNFNERRTDLSKDKQMVTKYKKKYTRKIKTTEATGAASAGIGDSLASTSMPVIKLEVLDSTEAAPQNDQAAVKPTAPARKRTYARSNTVAIAPAAVATAGKRTPKRVVYTRKLLNQIEAGNNTAITTSAVATVAQPPRKRAQFVRKMVNPLNAGTTTTTPANDTVRSLRDRNKALLNVLDQRSSEIRQLRMRITNMHNSAPPISDNVKTTEVVTNNNNGCSNSSVSPAVHLKLEPGLGSAASQLKAGASVANVTGQQTPAAASSDATPDWTVSELATAHSLHALHPMLYTHLHRSFGLPLPLATECVAWWTSVRIECGHLIADMLRIMQAAGAHLDALQRVTVLHITDLPLRTSFEYIERNDRLRHVPARRLHVVWARGLHGDWQLPLFVGTDGEAELRAAVHQAICQLHAIRYNVIACCARFAPEAGVDADWVNNNTDNGAHATAAATSEPYGAAAARLWQQLGVGRGYSYFSHPETNEPVYTFYFGDDLLRAVQRQLLRPSGGGFCTADRPPVLLTHQPLDELRTVAAGWYEAASTDARVLFSARTSELLRAVRPAQFAVCADFVDVFAGYARLMFESDYGGERLEAQIQTLSQVQLQLYKLRCGASGGYADATTGAAAVSVFKAATAHTIDSLKLLQHTMRQKYGRDAFPAHAVSVDILRQRWSLAADDSEASAVPVPARTLLDTIARLRRMCVPDAGQHESSNGPTVTANRDQRTHGAAPMLWSPIDVTRPERQHVQRLIDELVRPYAALAERQKFESDLWRMEERFLALWKPFYVGGSNAGARAGDTVMHHVLRDTLGKMKPAASLERAVQFMQQRIALRVAVVNELGGVERWPSYVQRTAAVGAMD